ncbi:MAG TPA: hypothetical protein VJQ46_06365, partial [Gemmatimonadales bacterium]|nr:hypothetical protein [Gemmatimonadales bacterium]
VRARVLWSAALALGIIALLGLVVARRAARGSALRLDPTAVAVLPFRVTGPDRSLDYLGEGIVDLLAVKLDGSTGPHAVPSRLLLGNLGYRQGMEVSSNAGEAAARKSGAGLMVDGSLVRSGASLELSATLRRTDGSGVPVRATASGSLDSFPALVDRLAAQLLAGHGGTTTALGELSSSRAIAEYLQAKAALRRGKYEESLRHYDAALDADSTFALAALEAMPAWTRVDSRGVTPRARRLAWTYRAKLSPKGQALLKAWLGANYPGPTSMLLDMAGWQDAVREAPDVADAWFELGDRQLHFGALNDVAHAAETAEGNFHRAIELDSGYVMPLEHLLLAKWYLEDTTEVRALGRLWSAQDTASADRADYMRWRLAVAVGDSAMVARQRARLGRWPEESLDWLTAVSQADGIGLGDVDLGFAERRRRALAGDELRYVQVARHDWLLNAGRPTEALAIVDSLASGESYPDWSRLQQVDDALFGDGDTAAAAAAVRELSARRAPVAADSLRRAVEAKTACRLGLWALDRSDSAGVRTRARALRLQRLTGLDPFNDDDRLICADLLEAWLAGTGDRARARILLDRADSLYLNSNTLDDWPVSNIVTARLRELIGDSPGARRAIARVPIEVPFRPLYQSTYQREQARLVLAAGDTAAAIRALRRYVALRASPEPALVPQRDSARAQLAALIGR